MKGLLKNNFYAVYANAGLFSIIMLLLGIFVIAACNAIPSLLIGYALSVMVGFSINAISGLGKECSSKWAKYKLTVPVKRTDIVKSYYISLLAWLLTGMVFAGICVVLSILLHGYPFDRGTDILILFTAGISLSLFMSAVFFPSFYLGGEEKSEAIIIISILSATAIFMVIVNLINLLLSSGLTTLQLILTAGILLACALLAFVLSYPLTILIFVKKEY